MPDKQLPVVPHPAEDEPLSPWIRRFAALNLMSVQALMGRGMSTSTLQRLDRFAHPEEFQRLRDLSGIPVDQLKAMTIAGTFPGTSMDDLSMRPTTLIRSPGEIACRHCRSSAGLRERLKLMPLCVRCGHLLDDGSGYQEARLDARLVHLQKAVEDDAQDRGRFTELTIRVDYLRAAVRHNWPNPSADEPPGRLHHALRLLADDPTTSSPAAIAVLLTRAYDPQAERDVEKVSRHHTGWWPSPTEIDPNPLGRIAVETSRLHATIRRLGVEVRHIPLAITLGASTPLVPNRDRKHRETWAATLRQHAEHATGIRTTLSRKMVHTPTTWPRDDPWTIRLLTDTVTVLHRDGLLDRDRAVETFKQRTRVPAHVLRRLPRAAREIGEASRVAAAWVWLTMTGAGALRVGHCALPASTMALFHDALTAEGRLLLFDYGLQELGGWPAGVPGCHDNRLSVLAGGDRDAG